MKEVSSMKDLESSSVILNDNPLEQTLRTFDDSCKNADLLKKEGGFHSSFVHYNSRQQQCNIMNFTYSSSSSNNTSTNGEKSLGRNRSLFSANRDSRLQSLVETIQKYKNETPSTSKPL